MTLLGVTYQACPACGRLTPLNDEVLATPPMPETLRDTLWWSAWTRQVYGCACGAGWEHVTSWGGAPELVTVLVEARR